MCPRSGVINKVMMMWCPGKKKDNAFVFLQKEIKWLTVYTQDIDYNQTAMGLSLVTSAVYLKLNYCVLDDYLITINYNSS
jgi:hypothetical protein